jgi:alpha-N-arabinofuranosidase
MSCARQVNQMSKESYAERAHQWGKAIKLLDPSVELILCGETGHSSWDHYVLQNAIEHISMHSIHIYTASATHLPNVTAPLCAERSIEMASALIDLARIEKKVPVSKPKPLICFDEWNVWDPERAVGSDGAEEHYTLSDALAVAVWLNVFVRQAKHVGMANIAQSVNVISPLMTTPEGIWKQTTWWPLLLFSKYMRGTTLSLHLECGAWDGETQPGWIRETMDTPWLDTSAAIDDDGTVNLAVVNISEGEDIAVEILGVSGQAQVFTVNGEGEGVLLDTTGKGVEMRESESKLDGKYTFPKHSFTLLRLKP